MTSKHTPGPWVVCPTNSGTFVKSERVAGYLAEVRYCRTTQDVKADARLIAAAPELLSVAFAVDDIAERIDHDPDSALGELVARARAAIAKATGA